MAWQPTLTTLSRRINPTLPGPGNCRAFGSTSFVDAKKRVIEHAWNYKDGKRNKHVVSAGPGATGANLSRRIPCWFDSRFLLSSAQRSMPADAVLLIAVVLPDRAVLR